MKLELVNLDRQKPSIVLSQFPVIVGLDAGADVCLDDSAIGHYQCMIDHSDGGNHRIQREDDIDQRDLQHRSDEATPDDSPVPLLRVAAVFQISDGLQAVGAGVLRGLPNKLIARRLELSPTIVQRLVSSLSARGYIEKNPETARYRLGHRSMILGASGERGVDYAVTARRELDKLAHDYHLNGFVSVLRGGRAIVIGLAKLRIGIEIFQGRGFGQLAVDEGLLIEGVGEFVVEVGVKEVAAVDGLVPFGGRFAIELGPDLALGSI